MESYGLVLDRVIAELSNQGALVIGVRLLFLLAALAGAWMKMRVSPTQC